MAVHSDYCTCPECVEKYTSKAMTDVTAPVDVEATARFKKDIQTVIDLIEAQAATIKQLEQWVRCIAEQKLGDEMSREQYVNVCFQDSYESCILEARRRLRNP